jgi:glycosyltransferase involved in cell wall biosynthesis
LNKRVIVDTGDACYSLARSLGDRTTVGLLSVRVGEQLLLRSADEIIVRGRAHASHVPGRATYIPDIAPPGVAPRSATALRESLGLEDRFVVGLVGSLIPSRRLGVSYGWDLIEALCETDTEVVALVVGDGPGLPALRRRADELGVSTRCRFAGRVPTARISEYVSAMDVAISTQTNDLVGQVRTTGKLPLYLACARPVLASHVGEAALILGPLGWTVPYVGVLDRDYPGRLGTAIEAWRIDPAGASARKQTALDVAREFFDEETMRERLNTVIDRVSTQ